ncbi:MAG: hypothetical protein K8T91_21775 [Planctomycetes bacterium]|nr:hypothetical protein [Planctomycetota bacterium]
MQDPSNPYTSPGLDTPADRETKTIVGDFQQYEIHEKMLIWLGGMNIALGLVLVLLTFFLFKVALRLYAHATSWEFAVVPFLLAIFCALLNVLFIVLGWGLSQLDCRVRRPSIALAVLGLVVFPFGTVVSAVALALLLNSKTRIVLSPHYNELVWKAGFVSKPTGLGLTLFAMLVVLLVAACQGYYFWRVVV